MGWLWITRGGFWFVVDLLFGGCGFHYSGGGGGGGGFTVVVVVVSFFLGFAARFWLLLWISLSFVMGFFWVFGGGGFPMGWLWVSLWWWWVYCSGRFALIFFFFWFGFCWRILVLLL